MLGVYRVTDSPQREDGILHLHAAVLSGSGLAHRVQGLGEVIGAALEVSRADAGRLGEHSLPFGRAYRTVEGRALRIRIDGSRMPAGRSGRRAAGPAGRAGSQQDYAEEDQGAEDDPQPGEVKPTG